MLLAGRCRFASFSPPSGVCRAGWRLFGMATSTEASYRFIDIGVNLTDPVFRGVHHGRRKHDDDMQYMLARAKNAGLRSMIITGGSLKESKAALKLAGELGFFATTGCHPTRSAEFDKHPGGPEAYLKALDQVISSHLRGPGRVVAVGECGLDYDRLHFATEETQRTHFRSQLRLAKTHHLPLFLHSRAAHADFVRILRDEGFGEDGGRAVGARGGVVHSFTGGIAEAEELMGMGFHISLNGCGLKTEENLATAKAIPLSHLLLETDAPWCSMTTAHASNAHLATLDEARRALYFPPAVKPEKFVPGKPVKGRNEPSAIGGVAWVVAHVQGVPFEDVVEASWRNTVSLFDLDEADFQDPVSSA